MSDVTRYFTTGTLLSCQATRKLYSHATDYVRASDYDSAQSQLAALREELATLQTKHERTESALNGSMKALTRVDNMWKKRWLDNTGEPAMALVVDDEFKVLFEEIKDYKQRLADAERRNESLLFAISAARGELYDSDTPTACRYLDAALNPNPEAASHDE